MAVNLEVVKTDISKWKPNLSILKSKKFIVIGIIAVLAIVFIGRSMLLRNRPLTVNTEVLAKKDLVQIISVTGNIEANLVDKSILSVSQKVIDVFVKEGQDIKKDTPLVRLDTADLEYQLQKALTNLESAKANDRNGLKSVQDAVTQAEVNLQKAQGDFDTAKRKFDGNQILFDSGYISKDEYEASKKTAGDLENQLKLVQIQLDNAKRNLEDYSKSSSQRVQLNNYKADVDNLNKKINDSTITSSIDGRVVRLDAIKDEFPRSDKNTVLVCDISVYKLVVGISQFDAVKIVKGQKVSLKVKGIDKKYSGTVSKVGEVADITVSGTNKESKVNIEVTIDSPDEVIKAGYEADADIVLNEKKGIATASFDSIKQDAGGKYVFIIEDGRAAKRYVKTGLESDFDVEITDGLKEGESYLSSPPDSLKAGDKVTAPGVSKK